MNESWTVSAGLRYSEDDKAQSRNEFTIGTAGDFSFAEEPAERVYREWMGHVTGEFRPGNQHLFHARFARAFRAGGFNSFTFGETARTYGPEIMLSYEAGYKGMPSERIQLAVNAYLYDYSDYQQALSFRMIIDGNPIDSSEWINIDGSRIFGLEFEGEVVLSEQLRLRGFYAFTDSELGSLLAFNSANPTQQWVNPW